MSYSYNLPPLGSTQPSDFYPPSTSAADHQQQQAFASSAALGLAAMSQAGSYHGGAGGRGSEDRESESVEPGGSEAGGASGSGGGGGKGKDKDGNDIPPEGEKKKQTRGARACTVCRKLKMRCVGAEEGPPCKRCKNGNHECIFEESQRGRRSNRKTDAMAKSLKSMEAKLESVLASISAPGLVAGSGGAMSDPSSQRFPSAPLNSGPGGAEGRGDLMVGTSTLDPEQAARELQSIRASSSHPSLNRADSNSAITRKDPITLPPISAVDSSVRFDVGGGVGSHADIGPSRTGGHPLHHHHAQHHHVHFSGSVPLGGYAQVGGKSTGSGGASSKSSPMEWSGVKDPAAADGSPRLHSLPDNTLNPLGLLAEASLRNTRKRPQDISAEVYDVTGDLHHTSPPPSSAQKKGKGKGKNGEEDEDGPASKKRKMEEGGAQGQGQGGAGTMLGMANRNYFAPGPMNILPLRRIVIEQRMPPALLEEKILSVEEVVELFALFFEHCAPCCPFLDADIHTPAATGSRSPFLFTCICTVAARYYTKRTDNLYHKCLKVAKRVAFDVMTKGYKSTEICQGFLLLCNWNQPSQRFEEERTYQFSGIAIRMATDLNLHRKTIAVLPPDIGDETRVLYERELLNRERTWLYTFICDRSVSTQMGKPYAISKEDFLIRNAVTWHRQPGALPSDSGLSAMVEMQRIVGRMIDVLYSDTRSVSGLNAHLDYPMLIRAFLQQLDAWRQDWSDPAALKDDGDEGALKARAIMRDFYHAYYRLFLLSFAVQHALEDPSSAIDLPSYCVMCFESAERMIIILRDFLSPHGILRYAIDSTFVYASYAATFLLKLVSPTFASFIDEEAAMRLVRETAEVLETAAIDEQHTPALYASFLRMLIENKLHGPRTAANSRAPTRPGSPISNGQATFASASALNGGNGAFTPSNGYGLHNGSSGSNGAGLESFLKSRAPSVGPEGMSFTGFQTPGGGGYGFDPTLGGAFPGGLGDATAPFSFGGPGGELSAMGGDGAGGGAAFDSLMVDDVLSANGFWSSMLMPGFGGPLAGLSGGSGTVFSGNPTDPFSVTPFHSRPPSPSQLHSGLGAFASSSRPTSSGGAQHAFGATEETPAGTGGDESMPPPPPPAAMAAANGGKEESSRSAGDGGDGSAGVQEVKQEVEVETTRADGEEGK